MKDPYSNLYSADSNKDCLVKDRIILDNVDNVKWNWSWSRRIRSGREANQLLLLSDQLNNFKFSSICDRWLWKGDASTPFSVKELRNLIGTSSDVNMSKFNWVNWIPLKVNYFVWRLIRNRTPLSSNLLSRGVCVASTLCSFCGLDEECLDHVSSYVMLPQDFGIGWWSGLSFLISVRLPVWSFW